MIFVLEDMGVRVDWLIDLVGDRDAEPHKRRVFWSRDVAQLLVDLDNAIPSLVILDHDLGGVPQTLADGIAPASNWSRDEHGLTGLDAAERMPVVACPVLVWSVNPVRAPQMVQTLRRRGMRTGWAPFGTSDCAASITRAVLAVASTPRT